MLGGAAGPTQRLLNEGKLRIECGCQGRSSFLLQVELTQLQRVSHVGNASADPDANYMACVHPAIQVQVCNARVGHTLVSSKQTRDALEIVYAHVCQIKLT